MQKSESRTTKNYLSRKAILGVIYWKLEQELPQTDLSVRSSEDGKAYRMTMEAPDDLLLSNRLSETVLVIKKRWGPTRALKTTHLWVIQITKIILQSGPKSVQSVAKRP